MVAIQYQLPTRVSVAADLAKYDAPIGSRIWVESTKSFWVCVPPSGGLGGDVFGPTDISTVIWVNEYHPTGQDDLILDLNFTTPGTTLPSGSRGEVLHFSRASTAKFFVNGVLTTAATNEPRITREGLILEPACTNFIPSSANNLLSDAAGWVALGATYEAGPTDPDGGNYSYICEIATNGNQRRYYITSGAGTAKTLSCKVSKTTAGGARYFVMTDNTAAHVGIWDIQTGICTSATGANINCPPGEDLGPEWRFSMTVSSGMSTGMITLGHSSNGTTTSYAGSTSKKIAVRHVQFEANEFATSWADTTRSADDCWLVTSRAIGSEYSIEVEYQPIGGSNLRTGTHDPILAIGTYGAAQSQEIYLNAGTAVFSVRDGANAEKTITSGSLATASGGYYGGMRKIVACSDGIARPAMLVDGREQTSTPAGAGTGVFTAMTPTQSKVRLGCTSAGVVGGVIIKSVRIRALRKPYSKAICGSSYNRAKYRGYAPDARVFACIGDSITDALQVDASITVAWSDTAARAKGTTWMAHNYGVGSQGLEDIAKRWTEHVKGRGYTTVIFQGGINSANADQSAAEMWAIAQPVLEDIRADGVTKLICWSLMPGGDATSSTRYAAKTGYNALLQAWCTANGATYYDAWTSFFSGTTNPIIDPTYNQGGDGLHLNQAGNDKAGVEIAALL